MRSIVGCVCLLINTQIHRGLCTPLNQHLNSFLYLPQQLSGG